jgi:thioredoxin reductase (NADPH)
MTEARPIPVDLLIVGAGPSGLYAAYYAGFRGFSVAILDSLEEPGGQLAALYPEKLLYDVAGFPAVRGRDLVANLLEQAAPFEPTYLLGHRAETLARVDGRMTVTSTPGAVVDAKAVLITSGLGTFSPRPLPGGSRWEHRGLRYFVPRLDELSGQDVVIVGGGDSALDWALNLEPLAKSITLVHRRDTFRAHAHSVQQLMSSSCRVLTRAQVSEIVGDDSGLTGVDVVFDDGTHELLEARGVVAALGFTAELGPIADWGLALVNRHIVVDTAMQTNLPGIFAAGDVTEYHGKVRLISVGFGEAATAVNNAAPVIDPTLKTFPGHSSDLPAGEVATTRKRRGDP